MTLIWARLTQDANTALPRHADAVNCVAAAAASACPSHRHPLPCAAAARHPWRPPGRMAGPLLACGPRCPEDGPAGMDWAMEDPPPCKRARFSRSVALRLLHWAWPCALGGGLVWCGGSYHVSGRGQRRSNAGVNGAAEHGGGADPPPHGGVRRLPYPGQGGWMGVGHSISPLDVGCHFHCLPRLRPGPL